MKKKIFLVVITVIFLAVGMYQFNSAYQAKIEFSADVISYIENKGYDSKSDIEEINIVCFSKKCDIYAAIVNFIDEPSVDYLYAYKIDSKQIQQFDVYNTEVNQTPKHKEERTQ